MEEKIKEISRMVEELRIEEVRERNSDVALREAYNNGYVKACRDVRKLIEEVLKNGKD